MAPRFVQAGVGFQGPETRLDGRSASGTMRLDFRAPPRQQVPCEPDEHIRRFILLTDAASLSLCLFPGPPEGQFPPPRALQSLNGEDTLVAPISLTPKIEHVTMLKMYLFPQIKTRRSLRLDGSYCCACEHFQMNDKHTSPAGLHAAPSGDLVSVAAVRCKEILPTTGKHPQQW